jgi:hypothetical protein
MLGDGCRYCQPQEYIDRLIDGYESQIEDLVNELARCRDVFVCPEPGEPGEDLWCHAIAEPSAVADYIEDIAIRNGLA